MKVNGLIVVKKNYNKSRFRSPVLGWAVSDMAYLDQTIQRELVRREIPASNQPNYSDCFAVMFSLKRQLIVTIPLNVVRIAIPLSIFCDYLLFGFPPFETAGGLRKNQTRWLSQQPVAILN